MQSNAGKRHGSYRQWSVQTPRAIAAVFAIKRLRTPAGFALAVVAAAVAMTHGVLRANTMGGRLLYIGGVCAIITGTGFRVSALGCLRKKEVLAESGVYSLCRHPLYLGSMLIAYGFCALVGNTWLWLVLTLYFVVFYGVTIVWEEIRLGERYGETHAAYVKRVPLIVPCGRWQAGAFEWKRAMRNGSAGLLVTVVALLATVVVLGQSGRADHTRSSHIAVLLQPQAIVRNTGARAL